MSLSNSRSHKALIHSLTYITNSQTIHSSIHKFSFHFTFIIPIFLKLCRPTTYWIKNKSIKSVLNCILLLHCNEPANHPNENKSPLVLYHIIHTKFISEAFISFDKKKLIIFFVPSVFPFRVIKWSGMCHVI